MKAKYGNYIHQSSCLHDGTVRSYMFSEHDYYLKTFVNGRPKITIQNPLNLYKRAAFSSTHLWLTDSYGWWLKTR